MFAAPLCVFTNTWAVEEPTATGDQVFSQTQGLQNLDDSPLTLRMQLQINLRKILIKNAEVSSIRQQDGDLDLITLGDNEFGKSHFTLSVDWKEQVRAVAKLNLSHLFSYEDGNKIDFNDDFDIEKFVDNAYVEFRNVGGMPIAIITGKRDLVLGLHSIYSVVPMPYTYWSNFQEKYGVLGLTVAFDLEDTVRFVDKLELTVFEAEGGDFNFNNDSVGFLARMEKQIGDTTIVVSYSESDNSYLKSPRNNYLNFNYDNNSTGIIGVSHEFSDDIRGWAEGLAVKNHRTLMARLPEGDRDRYYFGASVGGAIDLFDDSLTLVGSYTVIEDMTQEFGLGAWVPGFIGPKSFREASQLGFQAYHSTYGSGVTRTTGSGADGFEQVGLESDTFFGFEYKINLNGKYGLFSQ